MFYNFGITLEHNENCCRVQNGEEADLMYIVQWALSCYCDIEWFALEANRDHSVVFEIASKYCISDSFVDHDGYTISSKGFLPAVVDTMII